MQLFQVIRGAGCTHDRDVIAGVYPRLNASRFDVSHDGKVLVAVGAPPVSYLWDLQADELTHQLQLPSTSTAASNVFLVNKGEKVDSGEMLACICCDDGLIRFLDLQQGILFARTPGPLEAAEYITYHNLS